MRRLLLLLIIILAVPITSSNAKEEEYLVCAAYQVMIQTPVTFVLHNLIVNRSYAVVVPESGRVLIDFNATKDYDHYAFTTTFRTSDVKQDYIVVELWKLQGDELSICDQLYLAVIEAGGIPFQVTLFSVVMTLILMILFMGYVGVRDFRRSRREKKDE